MKQERNVQHRGEMGLRHNGGWLILSLGVIAAILLPETGARAAEADKGLVVYYTFAEDAGNECKDLGFHGNFGKVRNAEYLTECNGRQGVLRLNGKDSLIGLGNSPSLNFAGDLSFEMWMRGNDLEPKLSGTFLFWGNAFKFFCHPIPLIEYFDGVNKLRTSLNQVGQLVADEWVHVAVVVEYPRIRVYVNGVLKQDVYMPFEALADMGGAKSIGSKCPIDLDEVRIYRRALAAEEVAAHARGSELTTDDAAELAIEPNWYENVLALRVTGKGEKYRSLQASLKLLQGNTTRATTQPVSLQESAIGSGRYVGTAVMTLTKLENQNFDVVAEIFDSEGKCTKTLSRHTFLKKPDWIHNKEGYSDKVLPPWTPIQATIHDQGTVHMGVWGREYVFPNDLFMNKIFTRGKEILAAAISLQGKADGIPLALIPDSVKLLNASDTEATLQQTAVGKTISIRVDTKLEYDGYMIFDCKVRAIQDTTLESLVLDIPLRSQHATLCFGANVYPQKENPRIPLSVLHMGAIKGDLAFRFSPNVWIGDEELGLTWQAESNEFWRYSDPQKAMEVLPHGDVTSLRANWINVPVKLARDQELRYRFALQATPVKPLLRDAWDLRVLRSDPFGGDNADSPDFHLAERWIDLDHPKKDSIYSVVVPELNRTEPGPGRMPALEYYAKSGMRHLFIRAIDNWPWPTLLNRDNARQLHQVVDTAHALGLKVYSYLIHERMPTNVPEYDLYGRHMSNLPFKPYETCVGFCSNSQAFQDAVINSLARRLDEYGEDGIYLDGTGVHMKSCQNLEHGCGYLPQPGATSVNGTVAFDQTERGSDTTAKVYPTYPVFRERELLKRIYTVVKQRRPDGIIDIHSWYLNSGGLAYGDLLWTGEQWWHLRGKGVKYISEELPLDVFRTMFMGYQIGIAADALPYRLIGAEQKNRQMAAISLLHDIPIRTRVQDTEYYDLMVKLFQLRSEFGIKQARKLFYWNNQDYVRVTPEKCYATLFQHPENGVLAFVSNLTREQQTVAVQLNLAPLSLVTEPLQAIDPLTGHSLDISNDGKISLTLLSEDWMYLWIRKK
ncbi:MAG: glycoside hydrolase domain-containing protein [Lentisphaeria bacterium]